MRWPVFISPFNAEYNTIHSNTNSVFKLCIKTEQQSVKFQPSHPPSLYFPFPRPKPPCPTPCPFPPLPLPQHPSNSRRKSKRRQISRTTASPKILASPPPSPLSLPQTHLVIVELESLNIKSAPSPGIHLMSSKLTLPGISSTQSFHQKVA